MRIALLAVVIASSNLAVSLALGALGHARSWPRILTAFVLFESLGTVAGLVLGSVLARSVGGVGSAIAATILIGLGAWTATSPLRSGSDQRLVRGVTSWPAVMALALLLALDNVAVGFALGLGEVAPLMLGLVVALVTFAFCALGLWLGDGARRHIETYAVVGSGGALVAVGVAVAAGRL